MRVAFCGGMPPAGRGGASDPGRGLVGMQPEPPERMCVDADGEPAVPVAVRTDAAGEVPLDFVRGERRPVDAAVAQSSACGLRRVEAAQIFVGRDGDPVGARRVHGGHDAAPSRRCHRDLSSTVVWAGPVGERHPCARPRPGCHGGNRCGWKSVSSASLSPVRISEARSLPMTGPRVMPLWVTAS